ncbi:MAG: 2-isopropylmalate synthase [Planctomycetes bacterium]|nr:2-isopropylmalate synthase [Planctomycetota bacterium]MCB9917544.1 2-isopropylmalate synthase [Planctomycetota bacterium]
MESSVRVPTSGDGFEDGLIYDWNVVDGQITPGSAIQLDDETLRDGLQSPSAEDPSTDDKLQLLHLMDAIGIDTADIGLPGAGGKPREEIEILAREVANSGMRLGLNVACRTVVSDIEPVVGISQRVGIPIEVCAFIGSSTIRQYAEGWQLDTLLGHTRAALEFAQSHQLPVMYVTEDTSRAHPESLRALYSLAIELGAKRLCVCDTVGHSTPQGARAVVRFVKSIVDEHGVDVGIDWHGHRDRGLDIANCLAAIEGGATRIHGSALGLGERAGNTPMDLLLVNLQMLGWTKKDLTRLPEYCALAAATCGVPFPSNYPVFGPDAFETGTGVHAAAVIKAMKKGDVDLADRVYSGVPASMVGREQSIGVGPMSGKSNVLYCLERLGLPMDDSTVQRVLDEAKASKRLLDDEELRRIAQAQ